MINPLKKKTKQHSETMGLLDMANKVDELVKVFNKILQAKEDPENIIKAYNDLLDRQHEGKTEEASKGDNSLFNDKKLNECANILANDDMDKIKEASNGECSKEFKDWMVSNTYRPTPFPNLPESNGECPHCDEKHMDGYAHNPKTCFMCRDNPPEHEDEWEKEIREDNWDTPQGIMTKQTILRRGERIGNATTMLKVEMIIDYIRDNFVSKEKIKNIATQVGMRSSAKIVQLKTLNRIQIEKIIYDKILESLGLGD